MDYQPLIERWQDGDLQRWADALPAQLEKGLSRRRLTVSTILLHCPANHLKKMHFQINMYFFISNV